MRLLSVLSNLHINQIDKLGLLQDPLNHRRVVYTICRFSVLAVNIGMRPKCSDIIDIQNWTADRSSGVETRVE